MSDSPPEHLTAEQIEALITEARAGSPDALGRVLETCRAYLLRVANSELDARLNAKAGGSDIVQDTFLEAQRIFDRFTGTSQTEMLAWLRAILLNKMATFTRQFRGTDKRQVNREVMFDSTTGPQPDALQARTRTPSSEVMHDEQAAAVASALQRLPEHYRQVIVWRQWDELPFEEIARRLGRGVDAARMVWWRAIEKLQQELGPQMGSSIFQPRP